MPRAFAIAAHPDDIEFFMSGTLMRLGRAGYELHYLNLADGCCGSTEHDAATIAGIRREEAQAACRRIGAVFHESLCRDIEILYELPTLRRLAAIVRQVAPEILLVHPPSDYMEDHTSACRLAVTAAFVRGMPNFAVDPHAEPIDQDVAVYHCQPYGNCDYLGRAVEPDFVVDVTDLIDEKTAMLAEHRSQQAWLDASQGLNSYLAKMRELAAEVGRRSGQFAFAEGWTRHNPLGFCPPGFDPLVEALAGCVFPRPSGDLVV